MDDEMYRACRWCHSYTNGKCCRGITVADNGTIEAIYEVTESGQLSEVLGESLGSAPRKDFEDEIRRKLKICGLSDKRIKEFRGFFNDSLDQFLDEHCKPVCEYQVSLLYQRIPISESKDVTIKDPDTFWCRYFT